MLPSFMFHAALGTTYLKLLFDDFMITFIVLPKVYDSDIFL